MAKITLDEIARMAGVSKATVSRVMNNVQEGVSDATRQHVKKIIEELNYDTDSALAARRGMRSHSIGLIVPDITNPFFSELAREIGNVAMYYGYSVLLGNTGFAMDVECRYITAFIAKKVDGLILVSSGSECQDAHMMLQKYRVPCVLLDRDIQGLKCSALVQSDNANASYNCCDLLIRNGSRNVVYISGPTHVTTSQERLEGYKRALKKHNIASASELIKRGNYTLESGYNAVLELERAGIRYSGILAANDMMALGALKALQELSYRIPDEIEIIGFDNIVYTQYTDPPLTTVQQPTIEMGREAIRLMMDAIDGKLKKVENIRLQPKLLRRKTTR